MSDPLLDPMVFRTVRDVHRMARIKVWAVFIGSLVVAGAVVMMFVAGAWGVAKMLAGL